MERGQKVEAGDQSNEHPNEALSSARSEQIEFRVRPERHRRWRPEDRLRIVRETLQPGAVIAAVASRHGIGTGLLYTWRKELLTTAVAGFVPVQVEPEARGALLAGGAPVSTAAASAPPARSISGRIEIEFPHGVRVRVDGGVDEAVLRGVLAALDGR